MARKTEYTLKIDKSIGRKINEMRLSRGLSRQQLAKMIDVTHQQLQKYEKGINRICAGRLMELAKIFNIRTSEFFDELENFIPSNNGQDRLCIELCREFMQIKDPQRKVAFVALARTMH